MAAARPRDRRSGYDARVRPLSAAALLGVLVLGGCGDDPVCAGRGLAAASDAREEAAAMEAFFARCAPLSMRAFDASGRPLSMSDPGWFDRVDHVTLGSDSGPTFEHRVLEGRNLEILVRE